MLNVCDKHLMFFSSLLNIPPQSSHSREEHASKHYIIQIPYTKKDIQYIRDEIKGMYDIRKIDKKRNYFEWYRYFL